MCFCIFYKNFHFFKFLVKELSICITFKPMHCMVIIVHLCAAHPLALSYHYHYLKYIFEFSNFHMEFLFTHPMIMSLKKYTCTHSHIFVNSTTPTPTFPPCSICKLAYTVKDWGMGVRARQSKMLIFLWQKASCDNVTLG